MRGEEKRGRRIKKNFGVKEKEKYHDTAEVIGNKGMGLFEMG